MRCVSAALIALAAPLGVAAFAGGTAGATPSCDPAAISAGIGQSVSVLRCYDNWAYVTNGALGDSTSLAQLLDYGWRHYSGFPSSVCRDLAVADGVPAPELSSFRTC